MPAVRAHAQQRRRAPLHRRPARRWQSPAGSPAYVPAALCWHDGAMPRESALKIANPGVHSSFFVCTRKKENEKSSSRDLDTLPRHQSKDPRRGGLLVHELGPRLAPGTPRGGGLGPGVAAGRRVRRTNHARPGCAHGRGRAQDPARRPTRPGAAQRAGGARARQRVLVRGTCAVSLLLPLSSLSPPASLPARARRTPGAGPPLTRTPAAGPPLTRTVPSLPTVRRSFWS